MRTSDSFSEPPLSTEYLTMDSSLGELPLDYSERNLSQSVNSPTSIPSKPLITQPGSFLILSLCTLVLVIGTIVLDAIILERYAKKFYLAPGLCAGLVSLVTIILEFLLLRYQSNVYAITVLIADAVSICANFFATFQTILVYLFGPPSTDTAKYLRQQKDLHIIMVTLCVFQCVLITCHFILTIRATLTYFKWKQVKMITDGEGNWFDQKTVIFGDTGSKLPEVEDVRHFCVKRFFKDLKAVFSLAVL